MNKYSSIVRNDAGEIVCSIKEMSADIAVFLTTISGTYKGQVVSPKRAYDRFKQVFLKNCNLPKNARKTPTGKVGKFDLRISRKQFIKVCNLLHPDFAKKGLTKIICEDPGSLITELAFWFDEERPREVIVKPGSHPKPTPPPAKPAAPREFWELEKCFIDGLRSIRLAKKEGADLNDKIISQDVFNSVMFRAPDFLKGGKAA